MRSNSLWKVAALALAGLVLGTPACGVLAKECHSDPGIGACCVWTADCEQGLRCVKKQGLDAEFGDAASCQPVEPGAPCGVTDDCARGEVCGADEVCTPELVACTTSADCAATERCENRVCVTSAP